MKDEESDLSRITKDQLDNILGADRYSMVTRPEELQQIVRTGRLGIEVFPVLMGLVVLLFCAEHLMANFFYDEDPVARPSVTKGLTAT